MKTRLIFLFLTLSLFSLAQNGNKTIDETFVQITSNPNVSYFEVTSEMFKMLSESKHASPEYKDYLSKLSGLKMVNGGEVMYKSFLSSANLKAYSRLMTKREGNSQLSFYKKEGKSENEFLLVSTEMIIYVTGTIELKSIGEFEQVMNIAGSAFDM